MPARARIVLLAADGTPNVEIARLVGVSRATVNAWRARYVERGLAGLADQKRSGRRRSVDPRRIVTATLTPPPKSLGVTHWSSRLLAARLGTSHVTSLDDGWSLRRAAERFQTSVPTAARWASRYRQFGERLRPGPEPGCGLFLLVGEDFGVGQPGVVVDGVVISAFWSLRWEVLFSLALPLYVFAARATRRVGWLAFAAVLALVIWSAVHRGESSFYLPMFAIGTLLAVHWDALAAFAGWVGRRRGGWATFIVASLLLTGARWELVGLGMRESHAVEYTWIPVVGVTGLVLAAAFCPGLRRRLESPVVQWLGTVSFSLYLVHEPIIIAVRYLTVDQPAWVGVLISVPVSFLVAAAFWRLVERPCHRLSRSTGRRVERLRP